MIAALLALGCVAIASARPFGLPKRGSGFPIGPPPGGFPMGPPPGFPMGPPPGSKNGQSRQCVNTDKQLEANKALVLEANEKLFNKHDLRSIDKYFAKSFIEHNPTARDGTDGLKEFARSYLPLIPKDSMEVKRVLAEGEYVWLHAKFPTPGGQFAAIMDLSRVQNGKIVEHWDVIQEMAKTQGAKNPHPFF